MSCAHISDCFQMGCLMRTGGKAGLSASRRKRLQSRSPAAAAAEGPRAGQGPREGPAQAQESAVAMPQAAPAALPALTSWRKGPAVVQPPSSHAEGLSQPMLRHGSMYVHCRCPLALSTLNVSAWAKSTEPTGPLWYQDALVARESHA